MNCSLGFSESPTTSRRFGDSRLNRPFKNRGRASAAVRDAKACRQSNCLFRYSMKLRPVQFFYRALWGRGSATTCGRIRCQGPISGTLMQESRFSVPDTFSRPFSSLHYEPGKHVNRGRRPRRGHPKSKLVRGGHRPSEPGGRTGRPVSRCRASGRRSLPRSPAARRSRCTDSRRPSAGSPRDLERLVEQSGRRMAHDRNLVHCAAHPGPGLPSARPAA